MALPFLVWVVAGAAALAGVAATRNRGKNLERGREDATRRSVVPSRGLSLKEFLVRYLPNHAPEAGTASAPVSARPRDKQAPWIVYANKIFFPICLAGFLASYIFDSLGIVRILAVSGMIGFGTNWLAITMLFRPRQKHLLLGQGLIPSQRREIVEAIAEGVFRNLINEEIIKQQLEKSGLITKMTTDFKDHLHALLQKPELRADFTLLIETRIRAYTTSPENRRRLTQMATELLDRLELRGVFGALVTWSKPIWRDSALEEIDRWIEKELPTVLNRNLSLLDQQVTKFPEYIGRERDLIEQWLTGSMVYFIRRLDIKKTLSERLGKFDEEQVEKLIKDASNDQLGYITLLGGILGIIGGFVLWNPAAIIWIAAGTTALAGLDWALIRFLQSET